MPRPVSKKPAAPKTSARSPKALTVRTHPHLYQINTWVWLDELSANARKRITLATVPDAEWDAIAAWGFDLCYLMGIWQRSPEGRRISKQVPDLFTGYDQALPGWTMRDVIGSGYSISSYVPDARIGSFDDLDIAREKLRQRGMGLIVDFVPNHMGTDHPWLSEHPEYFVQGAQSDYRQNPSAFITAELPDGNTALIARGRDPYFAPWPDTSQLNYFNPATRAAMIGILKTIAQHADGVRCDMAMLALNEVFHRTWDRLLANWKTPSTEFWSEATAALPDFIWMAEVYWDLEGRMQELGFNYTYDKRLYDRLHQSTPQDVHGHLTAGYGYQRRMARFLENHDEPRSAAVFPPAKLRAVAVAQATLPGLRFYHAGQFEGKKIHPPVQLARVAAEAPDHDLQAFYKHLLDIAGADAFHSGEWQLVDIRSEHGDPSSNNLLAWRWRTKSDLRLVIVNLGAQESQGRVICPDAHPAACVLTDVLNGQTYFRDGAEVTTVGLYVRLAPYGSHIFTIAAAPLANVSGAAAGI